MSSSSDHRQQMTITRTPNSSSSTLVSLHANESYVPQNQIHDDGGLEGVSYGRRLHRNRAPSIHYQPSFASTSTLFETPPLMFVFDKNSVINSTLFSRNEPIYCVKTNRSVTKTSLLNLQENRTVAVWQRQNLFPDNIYLEHKGKKIRLSKWLQRVPIGGAG